MLWLKAWRARREPHFAIELSQEVSYLQRAFGAQAHEEALRRLAFRKRGSFEWVVIKDAARRLRR
jgi:hypothetical protein